MQFFIIHIIHLIVRFLFLHVFIFVFQIEYLKKDHVTYDEAIYYAIDEDSDFYANDGDWEVYWSDDRDNVYIED